MNNNYSIASKVHKDVLNKSKDIVNETLAEVVKIAIMRTPVLTGYARGNWEINTNNNPEEYPADPNGNPTYERVKQQALQSGERDVYINNGVPYIGVLEFGGRGRPPHAMLRIAMMSAQSIMDKITRQKRV